MQTTGKIKVFNFINLLKFIHFKAIAVTKASSSYWEGKVDNEQLQRVYGISFPDPKQLKQWRVLQEEAARRDHRKLGRDQELFMFNPMSPGSVWEKLD